MKYVLGVSICFLLIVPLVRAQDQPGKENKKSAPTETWHWLGRCGQEYIGIHLCNPWFNSFLD